MARPTKKALDYFPFDVEFFADDKIKAIAAEFGFKGEITAVKLLCAVYRNGYFAEWHERTRIRMLGELPGMSEGLLEQIVSRLVRWGFFDKDLFDSAKVLTSRGIQERYFSVVLGNKRKVDVDKLPYLLVDLKRDAKGFPREETRLTPEETQFPRAESTQIKEKENKFSLYPPPPPPRVYACVREEVGWMLSNQSWAEQVCMRFHCSLADLRAKLDEFAVDCETRGKTVHDGIADAQSHFVSWMMRKREIEQDQKRKDNGTGNQRRTSADYIAEAQQACFEETQRIIQAAKRARGEL